MPSEYATSEYATMMWIESGFETSRAVPDVTTYNDADKQEQEMDGLKILLTQRADYQKYFREDWDNEELLSEDDFNLFKSTIVNEVYCGHAKMNSGNALKLKKAVYDYIIEYKLGDEKNIKINEKTRKTEPLFNPAQIKAILKINKHIFNIMLNDIASAHLERNSTDYTFKRGLKAKSSNELQKFMKMGGLNCYTLANSISDKFMSGKAGAQNVVRIYADVWSDSILYNSIIFPAKGVEQLEFGIVSHPNKMELEYHGEYDGAKEYMLKKPMP